MAGFLYFFPPDFVEKGKLDEDKLRNVGIDSVFSENMTSENCCFHSCTGPNGKQGIVAVLHPASGGIPREVSYNEQSQTWFDQEGFWLGVTKGDEPAPVDLMRKRMFQFPGMTLIDVQKNAWSLPVVCVPEGEDHALPVEYGFEPNGKLLTRVDTHYRSAWDLASQAVDYLNDADQEGITERWPHEKLVSMAVSFLSINYRVTHHEIGVLWKLEKAVLDHEFVAATFMAVTNWKRWIEYFKKYPVKKKERMERAKTLPLRVPA